MMSLKKLSVLAGTVALAVGTNGAWAANCAQLAAVGLTRAALRTTAQAVVPGDAAPGPSGGLDFPMWVTLVDTRGTVCAVVNTHGTGAATSNSSWLGSRVISAQKANTANAFSHDGLALSTANLYAAVQPGGSLYGLQHSNPVDTENAYKGPSSNFGQSSDPLVGRKIGGVNVFGGGVGAYNSHSKVIGGIGVSGDTSCADHNIGWRVRNYLGLDHLAGVGGVAALFNADPTHPDNIIFDITPNDPGTVEGARNLSASGFGHPKCLNVDLNVKDLPKVQ